MRRIPSQSAMDSTAECDAANADGFRSEVIRIKDHKLDTSQVLLLDTSQVMLDLPGLTNTRAADF